MKGMYLALAVVVLFATTCLYVEADKKLVAPKFCNGLECPRYTVLEKHEKYEVRQYEVSNWVTTTEVGLDMDDHKSTMFLRLFGYITGNNDANQKIDMTVPVLTKVIAGPGPACESNFTLGFYLAPEVTSPPKPSNPLVTLTTLPSQKIYIRSFGGYAKGEDYIREAAELRDALPTGAKFDTSHFYTAGYDGNLKPWDRHNEVWLTAV